MGWQNVGLCLSFLQKGCAVDNADLFGVSESQVRRIWETAATPKGIVEEWTSDLGAGAFLQLVFLRHGGPPPKALHQSGLTMGKLSVHGEPKFSEGQPRVFTNLVRVKTLHEIHHGPEKVKIQVEAISVKDAKGYLAYTKAK